MTRILARQGYRPTVSIRAASNGNDQVVIAFSASLVRSVGLRRGQPVLVLRDDKMLRFKLRVTTKKDATVAHHLVKDGANAGLNIYTSELEQLPPGKYEPIVKAGWISIDLGAPRRLARPLTTNLEWLASKGGQKA